MSLGLWTLSLWLGSNLLAWWGRHHLLFKRPRHQRVLAPGPHAGSYEVEAHNLLMADGVALRVWQSGPAAEGPVRLRLLYLGGRGEDVCWAPHMSSYTPGLAVLAANYRGLAGSAGRASAANAQADALALCRHWQAQGPGGAPADAASGAARVPLVIMGRSLGTLVAIRLAAEVAPDALVLVSPVGSVAAIVGRRLPWLWPAAWAARRPWSVMAAARAIRCPVLGLVAAGDRLVAPGHSRRVLARMAGPVDLQIVAGQTHRSLPRCRPVQQALARFLEQHFPPAGRHGR